MPALHPVTGELPLGRHNCTVDEFEAAFVSAPEFVSSTTRSEVWAHWELARTALRGVVPVYSAWVGGSFVSSKTDPNDMDIVFVIDAATVDRMLPGSRAQQIVTVMSQGSTHHDPVGRRLDTYTLLWRSIPDPCDDPAGLAPGYYLWRGHWDDFWQRARTSPKDTPPTQADSIPRRGFLEVTLDDYPI